MGGTASSEGLLLEEVLESFAGIVWPAGGNRRRSGIARIVDWRSIFLDRHAKFKKCAVVFSIFPRNPLRNGLRAFELCSRVKMYALFAGVQFQLALGALAILIEARSQDRSAIRTARPHHGSHHARRARTHLVLPRPRLRRTFTLFLVAIPIAVPFVLVLPIH